MRSFFSSLSGWDWLDLIGLLMVLMGVIGEVWSTRKHNEFWEAIWGCVLVLGLALELIALPKHFIEAGKLKHLAEQANERAVLTESNNLVLEAQLVRAQLELLDLQHATYPRRIKDVNTPRPILSAFAGVPVHIISDQSGKDMVKVVEIGNLHADIHVMLRNNKWHVSNAAVSNLNLTHSVSVSAATPLGREDEKLDKAADALRDELFANGIVAFGGKSRADNLSSNATGHVSVKIAPRAHIGFELEARESWLKRQAQNPTNAVKAKAQKLP
jgi:hypothetical protein